MNLPAELAVDSPLSGIGVLVVDDRAVVYYGLRLLLSVRHGIDRCFGAATAAGALDILTSHDVDVAVVDHLVDGQSGLLLASRLQAFDERLRIVLTTAGSHPTRVARLDGGVFACVPRNGDAHSLVGVIEQVARGARLEAAAAPTELTAREREVLGGLAAGRTNAQIAAAMRLSVHTVKDHTRAVYRKLGARNRADAVARGKRLGLVA